MKKLFRLLINNGFFVLALLLAVTLYLAYSTTPTEQASHLTQDAQANPPADPETSATAETESAPVEEPARAAEQTRPDAAASAQEAPAATTAATVPAEKTEAAEKAQPAPVQTPTTAEPQQEVAAESSVQAQPEANAKADAPAQAKASAQTETAAPVGQPSPSVAEAEQKTTQPAPTASPEQVKTEQPADAKDTSIQPGLLFDPTKLEPRAILSRFNSASEAMQEARAAIRAGNYQWAAAIYASLLHFYPRADLAGELGNLFWRIGDKTWAHRAWRYAAQLLIREGRIDIARRFADNISKVDPALSQEIKAHLPKPKRASGTTSPN